MRLLFLALALSLLAAGCTSQAGQNQTATQNGSGQQAGTEQGGSQQPSVNADAELNKCLSDTCGVSNDTMSDYCRVSCWNDYAVATSDPSKCDKNVELINSSIGYNVCVEDVAKATSNAAPCSLIKGEFDRDLCYIDIAQYLNDTSICEKVTPGGILEKQDCVNSVEGSG
jgi:hypothetical protein